MIIENIHSFSIHFEQLVTTTKWSYMIIYTGTYKCLLMCLMTIDSTDIMNNSIPISSDGKPIIDIQLLSYSNGIYATRGFIYYLRYCAGCRREGPSGTCSPCLFGHLRSSYDVYTECAVHVYLFASTSVFFWWLTSHFEWCSKVIYIEHFSKDSYS